MDGGDIVISTILNTLSFEKGLEHLKKLAKNSAKKIAEIFTNSMALGKGILGIVTGVLNGIGAILGKLILMSPILALITLGGLAVEQAFKKVTEENQQVITNIKYIIFALKQALEPVINGIANIILKIINFLIKAVQVVAVLIKMITGKNIFAGATLDKFKDSMASAEKSSGGTAKNLKEAKKQLAGFDEMEVLQDTSSSGGGGVGGAGADIGMPDFDLSNLADTEKLVTGFIDNVKTKYKELGEIIKLSNSDFIDSFGKWGVAIKGVCQIIYGLMEIFKGVYDVVVGAIKIVVGLITGNEQLLLEGMIQFCDGVWEIIDGLVNIIKGVINLIAGLIVVLIVDIINGAEKLKEWIVKIATAIGVWFLTGIQNMVNKANEKVKALVGGFQYIVDRIKEKIEYLKQWLTDRFGAFGTIIGDVIGAGIKLSINAVLGWIEKQLNKPINTLNSLISSVNKVTGAGITKISTIKLPRLAKGGIVSMPGRGVPIGSAIAGERGREAVLPLQDSQVLSEIGQAIGKYITINATIENSMNGRVISRELQKINAENDFAYNR